MSSQHIPAWQKIVIKQQQKQEAGGNLDDEDPLNITTHLATGALTKREKQKLIRGETNSHKITKKEPKLKSSIKKKEKLAKEVRNEIKRKTVLKDQLRYLIEFYLSKVTGQLPENLRELPNVKANFSEDKIARNKDEDQDEVIEVWKFSKQKQNWLIKHFFNIEELPLEYDDLLIQYFKDLKGETLKQVISSKCHDNISRWNEYAELEISKIKDIVEGKEESKNEEEAQSNGSKDGKDGKDGKDAEVKVPPSKDIASRCVKLLKIWGCDSELELKSF